VRRIGFSFVVALAALWAACGRRDRLADPAMLEMFTPLAPAPAADPRVVALGRKLYFEARLSSDRRISCNTCHPLDRYGADGQITSVGVRAQRGTRNAPTVYNAAGHVAQFWDGRARTLAEQARGPLLNPVEMAMPDARAIIAALRSIPAYGPAFQAAFPGQADPLTFDNLGRAIEAFERGLVTPARWDRFLSGDKAALSGAEQAGFNQFLAAGCHACHSGALIGGTMFQALGVVRPFPRQQDLGRYLVTRNDAERMVFKVPSLRNVEKTAPYFHDGLTLTLADAVAQMGEYQAGKQLNAAQINSIMSFLKTLTGELPAAYIRPR
jgi:cytochrome c peroxidase